MKIGDYVRTKYGIIGKIVKEEPFMDTILIFLDNEQGNVTLQNKDGVFKVNHKEDIIKSSPNIIDLIEAGDLVKIENEGWVQVSIKFETLKFFDNNGVEYLYEEIEAIITKEQIERNEYKL